MAKEILIYSQIFSFTAQKFIETLEANKGEDVVIRANTPGGSVFAGWGMIAKIVEHPRNVTIKVDGSVASMGSNMLPFADRVEALNVSRLMIHRASSGNDENLPEEQKQVLAGMNADLRAALEKKVDESKLKELKGVGFDEIFNSKERIDVFLTAQEGQAIGLVDHINNLVEKDMQAHDNVLFNIAALGMPETPEVETPVESGPTSNQTEILKPKIKSMNIDKLKAEHPEVYAQAVQAGVDSEKDRINAWMTFADVDVKAVKTGVESGESISQTAMAELMRKSASIGTVKAIEKDNAEEVVTDTPEGPEAKATELENFEKEVQSLIK